MAATTAPRTDPSVRSYRTRLLSIRVTPSQYSTQPFTSFVRLQFQPEPCKSFAKGLKEPLCLEVMLETQHEVVSVAHDDDVTTSTPPPLQMAEI